MVIEGSAVMKRKRDRFFRSYGGDGTERFSEKILAEVFKINRGGDIMIVEEILRIKAIIEANFNQSEVVLLELLRRLVLIAVSFNTLKETMIGMSVKSLTKHNSKRVCELARYLITKWRRKVDEWLIASEAATAAATKEVVTVSSASDVILIDEEERLKRNEDGFCGSDGGSDDTEAFPEENAEQNNKIIAEIFRINRGGDIMILEELLRITEVIKANFDHSEVALLESLRRLQLMAVSVDTLKETQIGISVKGLTKHSSKRVRDIAMYLITEWRRRVDEWLVASEAATSALTSAVTKDVVKGSSASDVLIEEEEERLKAKMEVTKRKLKEGYQRAENAKKQRRARVMELKDLPNQGFCNCKSFGNNGLISV
ncbi:probable mediator of RNA polymerase II transcription subunit 26b [Telopea speciosissima]|uniref:probable mediator of RNA polymerase II transcription subunit 26b n=1 Tax=Telopea speciosissima TaxID=54955 RepID=UPI001CC6C932|nr:probable mediator of RNA polymerase II transcription subunit 26b [Telopea speciosissima]